MKSNLKRVQTNRFFSYIISRKRIRLAAVFFIIWILFISEKFQWLRKLNPPLNYLDHMRNKLELSFLVLHGKHMYVFITNFHGKELCYSDV